MVPYAEPPPDPELIRQQTAVRAAAASRAYESARTWVLRPSLMLAIVIAVLAGCVKAVSPGMHTSGVFIAAVVLAVPGVAWTLWRLQQRSEAVAINPAQVYELAYRERDQRAAWHEEQELQRLRGVPEWTSAEPPALRTDVFGGTLAGWRSLLTVHGASILARQPLLIADLSGQDAALDLAALAQYAQVPTARYLLPRDLNRAGLLTRLVPAQLASALAEAIHAGSPGSRADRAIDVRVLEQLCTALRRNGITPARLAAAVETALGRTGPPGMLTEQEISLIQGSLFGQDYKTQIGANLVRLDAFLSDLARHTGTGPPQAPPPAWCTLLVSEPAAASAHAELLDALVVQWLTVQITGSTATTPSVILASADQITRDHLERLAAACEQRGVHLTLLFRHLRDDATALIGGGTTGFMRLGNHHEAEQAASFLGRDYRFVLSQVTATHGSERSHTTGSTETWGTSESRGTSTTHGWSEDELFHGSASGSRIRSRDRSSNYSWAESLSQTDGTSWSDSAGYQRVYEYRVEPSVLQNLPGNALLLADRSAQGTSLHAVECHPAIVTLPNVDTRPLNTLGYNQHPASTPVTVQAGKPQLGPPRYQPQWPQTSGSPADAHRIPVRQTPIRRQPPETTR
jgi:hypothetical protein